MYNYIKTELVKKGIPAEEFDFFVKKTEQYERDLEQSKLEYEKSFAQEAELSEKIATLNELNVLLDIESGTSKNVEPARQEKE